MNNHVGWGRDGRCVWCSSLDPSTDCLIEKNKRDKLLFALLMFIGFVFGWMLMEVFK